MNRFGDMVECNPSVKIRKGAEVDFIAMEQIVPGIKQVDSVKCIYEGQSGAKFSNGDTIMARITPCLENGKIAQCNIDGDGFGSTEFFVFRGIKNKTDDDYVYYLVRTNYIRQMAINSMTGASGRQRADISFVKRIKWEFPDLNRQKQIAGILSKYDELIRINRKRIELLKKTAEEIYKEWFVRFRFPGAENTRFHSGMPCWDIKKIEDVAFIKAGGDRPSVCFEEKNDDAKVPIYSNGIERDGLYGYTDEAAILEESITISARGTIGYICLRREPYMPIVRLLAVVPKTKEVSAFYLYYCLQKDSVIGSGTSQQQITAPMVRRKRIIIPDQEVMDDFTNLVRKYWDESDVLLKINEKLLLQRDRLLERLMAGNIG